jgi:dienelactone hydrolase
MRFSGRKPGLNLALYVALLLLPLAGREASAAEPYRMLSPTGAAPHPAVLLVPGCSGFVATNGVSIYDERAAELQAAGYFVVFVDYVNLRVFASPWRWVIDIIEFRRLRRRLPNAHRA